MDITLPLRGNGCGENEKTLFSGWRPWKSRMETGEDLCDLSGRLNGPMCSNVRKPDDLPIEYYRMFVHNYFEHRKYRKLTVMAHPEEGKTIQEQQYEIGALDLLIAVILTTIILWDNWDRDTKGGLTLAGKGCALTDREHTDRTIFLDKLVLVQVRHRPNTLIHPHQPNCERDGRPRAPPEKRDLSTGIRLGPRPQRPRAIQGAEPFTTP